MTAVKNIQPGTGNTVLNPNPLPAVDPAQQQTAVPAEPSIQYTRPGAPNVMTAVKNIQLGTGNTVLNPNPLPAVSPQLAPMAVSQQIAARRPDISPMLKESLHCALKDECEAVKTDLSLPPADFTGHSFSSRSNKRKSYVLDSAADMPSRSEGLISYSIPNAPVIAELPSAPS